MMYELLQGQLLAETAVVTELDYLRSQRMVSEQVYLKLHFDLTRSQHELSRRLEKLDAGSNVVEQQRRLLQRRLIDEKQAPNLVAARG